MTSFWRRTAASDKAEAENRIPYKPGKKNSRVLKVTKRYITFSITLAMAYKAIAGTGDQTSASHAIDERSSGDGTEQAGGTQTRTYEAGTGQAGGTQTPTDEARTGQQGNEQAQGNPPPAAGAGNGQQKNDTFTGLPLNQNQGNGSGDKYPIQETDSPKDFDPLQEIKATLPDGPDQIGDNLRLQKNQERYRRFLLHVARNTTGKWREIGERLEIEVNKLESLNADYKHEGSPEQAYQMLVYWRESDKKPTLEKLLFALIDTGLKQVAEQISDMLIDRRNRGGKAVTEQLLFEITDDVKDIWKFLGRYLAINESDIHCIKMDNDGNTWGQARQMLVKWMRSNGKSATTGILVNALGDVGKTNVADYLEYGKDNNNYPRSLRF